jgi:hypothetical protein
MKSQVMFDAVRRLNRGVSPKRRIYETNHRRVEEKGFENMKTTKSSRTNATRRILLIVPVTCSMAFAACSEVAGTAGTRPNVNLQTAPVGELQTADNVPFEAGKSPSDMIEDHLLESN